MEKVTISRVFDYYEQATKRVVEETARYLTWPRKPYTSGNSPNDPELMAQLARMNRAIDFQEAAAVILRRCEGEIELLVGETFPPEPRPDTNRT